MVSPAAPGGSLYIDQWGDIWTVGDLNGFKFVHQAYSPTWATMTVPVKPRRWLDTRGLGVGNSNVVPGSANITQDGRIVPKGTNGPDLVLDFSSELVETYVAVQVIVSVHASPGDGWLTLWGDGVWPEAVSVNFLGGRVIGGFAQCELTGVFQQSTEPFGRMKLKITHQAAVTIDVVGFITPDKYALFKIAGPNQFGISATGTPKAVPRKG